MSYGVNGNVYSDKFMPSNVNETINDQEFVKHEKALRDFSGNNFGKIENSDKRRSAIWESAKYLGNIVADPHSDLRQRALEALLDQAFSQNTMVRNLVTGKLQQLWNNTKEGDRPFFRQTILNKLRELSLSPEKYGGFTDDSEYQKSLGDWASKEFCKLVALLSPKPLTVEAPLSDFIGGELSRSGSHSPTPEGSHEPSFTISEMHQDNIEQKDDGKDNGDNVNNVELDRRYEVDEKGFNEFDRIRMKCDYSNVMTNSYSFISKTRKISSTIEKEMILSEEFVQNNFEDRTLFVNRESGFATVLEGNCIYKTRMDDFDEKELQIPVPRDPLLIGDSRTLELSRTQDLAEQVKKLSSEELGAVRLVHDRERKKYGLLFLHNGNHFLFTDNQRGKNVGYVDQLRGEGNWGIYANNESKPNKFDLWVRKSGPFKGNNAKQHWEYLTSFLRSLRDDSMKSIHPSAFYRMFNEYLENVLSKKVEKDVGDQNQDTDVNKSKVLKNGPIVPEPVIPPLAPKVDS